MNGSLQAVFLTTMTFLLYVLIPMIPAVVIYRLFPKNRVSAKGVLSGITINTGGAFAAYLIVVLLGKPLVDNINNSIHALSSSVWTVKIPLRLVDEEQGPIDQMSAWNRLDQINIKLRPDIHRVGQTLELHLPVLGHDEPDNEIRLDVPGFGFGIVRLHRNQEEVEWNGVKRTIVFNKPVDIHYADASAFRTHELAQPIE